MRGPKNSKNGTQRGPNFEQKGDQKGTQITQKGTQKGTQSSIFSELFTKGEYVKIVKSSKWNQEQKHIALFSATS